MTGSDDYGHAFKEAKLESNDDKVPLRPSVCRRKPIQTPPR
jgi:hypothetical protein